MPTSSSSFTSCNPGCLSKHAAAAPRISQTHKSSACSAVLLFYLRVVQCAPPHLPASVLRGIHNRGRVSWMPCLRHDERGSLVIFIREAVEIACSTPCAHVGRVFRLWEPGAIPMVAGEMLKKGLPDWFRITFGYWAFPFADPAVDSGLARRHRAGRWHYILQPRHFFLC